MPQVLNEEETGLGITLPEKEDPEPLTPPAADPTAAAREEMAERQVRFAQERAARGEPDPQADLFRRQAEEAKAETDTEARQRYQLPERVKIDQPTSLAEYMHKDFATQLPWERGSRESRKQMFRSFVMQNEGLVEKWKKSSLEKQQEFYDTFMAKVETKYPEQFQVLVEPEREEVTQRGFGVTGRLSPKREIIRAKYRPLLDPARERFIASNPEVGKSELDPFFMVEYFKAMESMQGDVTKDFQETLEDIPIGDVGRAALRGAVGTSAGPIVATAVRYEGNKFAVKMGEHEDYSEEQIKERAIEAAKQHVKAFAMERTLEGFGPGSVAETIAEFTGMLAAFVFDPITKTTMKPGQWVFNKGMVKFAEKKAGKVLAKGSATAAERQMLRLMSFKTKTAGEVAKAIPKTFGAGAAHGAAVGASYGMFTYGEPVFPDAGERWDSFIGKVGMDATIFAAFGGTIRSAVEALRLGSPLFYKTRVNKVTKEQLDLIEIKRNKQDRLNEELRREYAKGDKANKSEMARLEKELKENNFTQTEEWFVNELANEAKKIVDAGGRWSPETAQIEFTTRMPRDWTTSVPGLGSRLPGRARVDVTQAPKVEPPRETKPAEAVEPPKEPVEVKEEVVPPKEEIPPEVVEPPKEVIEVPPTEPVGERTPERKGVWRNVDKAGDSKLSLVERASNMVEAEAIASGLYGFKAKGITESEQATLDALKQELADAGMELRKEYEVGQNFPEGRTAKAEFKSPNERTEKFRLHDGEHSVITRVHKPGIEKDGKLMTGKDTPDVEVTVFPAKEAAPPAEPKKPEYFRGEYVSIGKLGKNQLPLIEQGLEQVNEFGDKIVGEYVISPSGELSFGSVEDAKAIANNIRDNPSFDPKQEFETPPTPGLIPAMKKLADRIDKWAAKQPPTEAPPAEPPAGHRSFVDNDRGSPEKLPVGTVVQVGPAKPPYSATDKALKGMAEKGARIKIDRSNGFELSGVDVATGKNAFVNAANRQVFVPEAPAEPGGLMGGKQKGKENWAGIVKYKERGPGVEEIRFNRKVGNRQVAAQLYLAQLDNGKWIGHLQTKTGVKSVDRGGEMGLVDLNRKDTRAEAAKRELRELLSSTHQVIEGRANQSTKDAMTALREWAGDTLDKIEAEGRPPAEVVEIPKALEYLIDQVDYEGGRFLESDALKLSKSEHAEIDAYMEAIDHPSRYEPGKQVDRFIQVAKEIAAQRKAEAPPAEEPPAPPPAEVPAEEAEFVKFLESPKAQTGPAPKKADKRSDVEGPVNVPISTANGPKPLIKGEAVQGDALYKALDVVTSATTDRPMLNGVYMNAELQRAEATDGRKFVIVPAKVKKAGIFYGRNKKSIVANKVGDVIDERFVNISRVTPDLHEYDFEPIELTELWKVMEGVKKAARHVNLDFLVKLSKGDKIAALNHTHLQDVATALRKAGFEKAELGIKDAESPVVIRAGEALGVIMPVREWENPLHRPVELSELTEAGRPRRPAKPPKGPEAVFEQLGAEAKAKIDEAIAKQRAVAEGGPEGVEASPEIPLKPRRVEAITTPPDVDPKTKRPLNPADIRRYLSQALDIPVRLGVNRMKALGYFRTGAESIRLAAINDISTLAHEVGHYLHWIIFSDVPKGEMGPWGRDLYEKFTQFEGELSKLGAATSRPSYTKQQVRMEGVAEFVRHWMDPHLNATAEAPNFSKHFRDVIEAEYPETWKILNEAKKMYAEISKYPARSLVRMMITSGQRKSRMTARKWWSRFMTRAYDENYPFFKTLDDLVKSGMPKELAEPIVRDMTNHIGGTRARAEYCIQHKMQNMDGEDIGPGFLEILSEVPDVESFSIYLVAGRALELHGRGMKTGIDKAAAKEIFNDLKKEYEPHRKKMLRFQGQLLDLLADSGILNQADLANMKAKNKMYAPFHRFFETVMGHAEVETGRGLVSRGKAIRRIKGSDAEIIDPLESIIKNVFAFWDLAVSNDIAARFVNLINKAQGGGRVLDPVVKGIEPTQVKPEEAADFVLKTGLFEELTGGVEIDPVTLKMKGEQTPERMGKPGVTSERDFLIDWFKKNPAALKIWRAARKGKDPAKGIFTTWRNGKETLYETQDKDLYQSLLMMNRSNEIMNSKIFQFFAFPAHVLKAGAVGGLNPEFGGMNFFRAEAQALFFSKRLPGRGGYIPIIDGFRGLAQTLFKGKDYKALMKHGGLFSSEYSYKGNNLSEILEDALSNDPKALKVAKRILNPLKLGKNLSAAQTAIENAARASEMRNALMAGEHPRDAANEAKEIGLNFSRRGSWSKIWNDLVPFFVAGILDFGKFVKMHKTNPGWAMLKGIAMITGPSLALWHYQKDSERIKKLEPWRKNFFWNIDLSHIAEELNLPWMDELGDEFKDARNAFFEAFGMGSSDDDFIFSYPKPFLAGTIYASLPEALMERAVNENPKAVDAWWDDFWKALPGGWEEFEETGINLPYGMVPTFARPTGEIVTNYNFWTQRELVPETLQNIEESMQWTHATSEVAKLIAEKANAVGLKWSPMHVDHFIRGHLAGAGRLTTEAIDFAIMKLAAEENEQPDFGAWERIPILRKFKVPAMAPSREVNEFYEASDKLKKLFNTVAHIKDKDFHKHKDWWNANKSFWIWYNAPMHRTKGARTRIQEIDKARERMGKYMNAINATQTNAAMTGEEKAKRMLRLKDLRDQLAADTLKLIFPEQGGKAERPK